MLARRLATSAGSRLSSSHHMPNDTLVSLELPGVAKVRSGKVREVFDLGETLLFVATDRLSAFDVILPDPIPDKGAVLNQISAFWFEKISTGEESFYHGGLREISGGVAAISRATGWALDDRPQDQAAAGRVCRAWLSRRFRVEGLSGDGRSLRAPTSGWSATGLGIAGADLHAFDQERSRARPEHRLGAMLQVDRRSRSRAKCAT